MELAFTHLDSGNILWGPRFRPRLHSAQKKDNTLTIKTNIRFNLKHKNREGNSMGPQAQSILVRGKAREIR